MPRVAFVNMGCYSLGGGAKKFSEPSHLLAMHNICRKAGHQSRIFQFDDDSSGQSIDALRSFSPDVVGLSFINYSVESLASAQQIADAFPDEPRPLMLMGGCDVRYNTRIYKQFFSGYGSKDRPLVLVRNEGEAFIQALAGVDFNVRNAIEGINADLRFFPGVLIADKLPRMPLSEQDFTRDYDLSTYDYFANARWAVNCWANCNFCANEPAAVEYRSPDQARGEAEALIASGAKRIQIPAPNFTGHPRKAASIVAKLPSANYSFESRVDTLYFSLRDYPEAWKRFRQRGNRISMGVEKFSPQGLMRLGKYKTLSEAEQQSSRLDFILSFFHASNMEMQFYLIPLDVEMPFEEARFEAETALKYLRGYPNVSFGALNHAWAVFPMSQSPFSEQMRNIDFYNFRDPRLLFLCFIMREKTDILAEMSGKEQWHLYFKKHFLPIAVFNFFLKCMDVLGAISIEQIKIDRALQILQTYEEQMSAGGDSTEDILSELFSGLNPQVRKDLDSSFKTMIDSAVSDFNHRFGFQIAAKKGGLLGVLLACK